MSRSMKSRTKFAFAVTCVALIITSCIGIFWIVRDSSANTNITQSTDLTTKQVIEDPEAQLNSNSATELSNVTILEEEMTEQKARQLAIKVAVLESERLAEASAKSLSSLEEALRNFLGNEAGKVGLIYYDISSGNTISINGSMTFNAASTFKVPLAMIMYDQVSNGSRQ